ncbi:CRISPR-associated endonuclease Cas2 [Candidatus Uhrbacteria bacterium]|jgi:CRISPR-associated endonuclease Cas2|nr:CRISPR-associated endonuclease Cas2 [Candidatus Uhrbacteria bacterium]MBT7717509.1 CRISPR-associated endonuclease Cas2 [Candidatus Uhrbacteria bacterium]
MSSRPLQDHSRASDLLINLGDKLADIHLALSRPSLVVRCGIDDAWKILDRKEKSMQQQALRRLKERKLIQVGKIADELHAKFTQKGLEEYLKLRLVQSEILNDRKVCMVIFDIPESQSQLRRMLRNLLKRSAFIQLQKSVWISNIDATDTLSRLFETEIRQNWIQIYIAKKTADFT